MNNTLFITVVFCFCLTSAYAEVTNQTSQKSLIVNTNPEVKIVAHAVVNFTNLAKKEAAEKKSTNTAIKHRVIPIGEWHKQQIPPEDLEKLNNEKQINEGSSEKKSPTSSQQTSFSSSSSSPSADDEIKPGITPVPLGPVTSQDDFQALPQNVVNGYLNIPPDTMGVAGKNHLMTVLNSEVRIQQKDGTVISTVSLSNFWAAVVGSAGGGNAGAFDPKIIYDYANDKYIFVTLDDRDANNGILIAVSQSDDPTAGWYQWKIDADSDNNEWADFPSPGYNTNWIAISVNMFQIGGAGSFTGARIFLLDKKRAYTNDPVIVSVFSFASGNGFTIAPCVTFGNQTNIYTIDSGWYAGNDDYVRVGVINGPVNSPTWNFLNYYNIPDTYTTTAAPQLNGGTTNLIDGGDSRIGSPPIYRFNNVYFTYSGQLSNSVRDVIVWGELNIPGLSIVNTGIVQETTTPMFYSFPSIAVNSQTSIVIGFAGFSTGIYGSAYYTGREFTNAPNVMQEVKLLKAGEDYYYQTFGGTRNRWGDYSATCVDPADDLKFWTIQEYAMPEFNASYDRWGTWWGHIYFVPEPVSISYLSFIICYLLMNRGKYT